MAFDGITVANLVSELEQKITGGKVYKIAQPEKDELILTIKTPQGQQRLLISADASLPLTYLMDENKTSPMNAPNFCMLLRKHIQNAKILSVEQPGLERIIRINMEHLDELGDLCQKTLIIEIMGKHSNIIFTDQNGQIIDSIKHISALVSSVREVLPGKTYFVPETEDKKNPLTTNTEEFIQKLSIPSRELFKAIYSSYTGISPFMAQELCYRAEIDASMPTNALTKDQLLTVWNSFEEMMRDIKNKTFSPRVIYEYGKLKEYSSFHMESRKQEDQKEFETISELLNFFYAQKNRDTRIYQRSTDLRKIVQTALERSIKKLDLQEKQQRDTEDRDTYRVYGELLNTYGYSIKEGDKKITVQNYYTNSELDIPLDPQLTAKENARRYFEKYAKQKRTHEALLLHMQETRHEVDYLQTVQTFLKIAAGEDDLLQIREELVENGFIKKHTTGKKKKVLSKPFHYVTKEGYDIYVGKNNIQNEELSFKFASGNDWWFHAKGVPGSHVIVKAPKEMLQQELPDSVFEAAGSLAAHYSQNGTMDKVEVDYTQKKYLKKPAGGKIGLVIYHTNYSMLASTEIQGLDLK